MPSSASTWIVSSTSRPGTVSSNSSSSRAITCRSSNSAATSRSRERSGAPRTASAGSIGTSTSYLSVASCFETRASSAWLVRFSLRLAPEISSTELEHRLERAELLEELRRRLVADAGDAGDVVGRVALQPDQVGHQLGRHAVALDHALVVVDPRVGDPARGRHHPDPVADHLVDVAVAGDDHHRDPGLARLRCERADHVVGLVAVDLDVREAERLGERREVRPLLLEEVGARLALGLVLGVLLLAARPARVPGDDHALRLEVGEQLDHHRREAVDRVRRPPVSRSRSTRAARRTPGRRASCRRSGRARRRGPRPRWPSSRASASSRRHALILGGRGASRRPPPGRHGAGAM